MRLVATNRLQPGMILGRDVLTDVHGRVPLLRRGIPINERYKQSLLDAGIHAIYVDDALGSGIEVTSALSEATRETATKALVRSFSGAPTMLEKNQTLSDGAIHELADVAARISQDVAEADDAVLALSDLAAADRYTLQHSLDVTALGVLIARRHFRLYGRPASSGRRRYDQVEQYLVKLGVGLLLHDIGKLVVPAAILNKPGPLDPEEQAIMRTHPLVGLELLPGDVIGPLAKSVVRSHHERWDGSGYPNGLAGTDISEFARIAAVADVFDAITSERPYARAAQPYVGVRAILEGSGTYFDPTIVESFRKVVAPYPPGSEIVLGDGRRGVVVSVPVNDLEHPVVRIGFDPSNKQIEPYEIDLGEQPHLLPQGLRPAA
jgi:HD-GYP domain-containing protein (c-di-GMP phosphodiesterase class II)